MRTVCLVTNYNYAAFLEECLSSALLQTRPFDKIIVVDDGSSDNSVGIIDRVAFGHPSVRKLEKRNGGQLSCFNHVADEIDHGDLVFFMDSDDIYPKDYVENVCTYQGRTDADLVFVTPVEFSGLNGQPVSSCLGEEKTFQFACTSALTRMTHCWIGSPTSCICLKGALYHKLFPCPFENDWTTRADDVIVFGSSILGTSKLYIESVGIGYRVHGRNNFFSKTTTPVEESWRSLALERLFGWYSAKTMVPQRAPLRNALAELRLIPKCYRKRFFIPGAVRILTKAVLE